MELRQLQYFVAVAEELHFGHAARREHLTEAALSQQVQRLERELGVRLLDRTTRRVKVTPIGRLFLDDARVTLARAKRAADTARRARQGEVGRLLVGYPVTGRGRHASAILRAFHERYPEVMLTGAPGRTADLLEELRHEQLDVAFIDHEVGQEDDDRLTSRIISRKAYKLALPAGHPLARQQEVRVEQLAAQPLLFFPRQISPHHHDELMEELSNRIGAQPKVAEEATILSDLLEGVEAGIGLALVADVNGLGTMGGNVVVREFRAPAPTRSLVVAWRTADHSPALIALLGLVDEFENSDFQTDRGTGVGDAGPMGRSSD
jgi:DNA-binding transcriptional LysR family regulator